MAEAYAHCERITRAHYENFPVASRLLPKALRPHVCAVYAFARAADDFSDEAAHEGERLDRLNEWEALLSACLKDETAHPVFVALGDTIRRCDLPVQPLRDLLTAFRMDVTTRRHPTFDDLLHYCRYSANPVGRVVLGLFGLRDPDLAAWSDRICTALQLTNFWQDIAIDLRKERIYLPQADMEQFGVSEEDLFLGHTTPAFVRLLRFEVARTRDLFHQGLPLVSEMLSQTAGHSERPEGAKNLSADKPRFFVASLLRMTQSQGNTNPHSPLTAHQKVYRRLSYELRLTWLGGMRILDRIEAGGCDVFNRRPTLTARDKIALLYRAWRFKDRRS
ncbi:MAG: squalene synthase HpnC [Candidatus Handelsmanbacteria bacterium RIFCSPLOWO2_12_FULL_64_10]|uniref:Squalene synthase HpnC n=1 Tax=Handelsmanbacteria sp. (strain RIFCSPLOWO2_12_FULL_64_10) TaxID=1817868 RepID=A0A1F6D072_HANXR|nr:MAG: squalene synthase HpnC [Candidatus Handelsmanbacteria bacterium RIFCSPLOWO2_12_FULL_64_10]